MSLDGVWNFATDPDNRGEAEKWYEPGAKLPRMPLPGYAPDANGTIRVPGIWDHQGYGKETDKVHHNFVGKGWYRRQVAIPPSWANRRVFLGITGVSRRAKAWIGDKYLGDHVGYLSAFEWDVSEQAAAGHTATITIEVDSQPHWETDSMFGSSSLTDYIDVAWGGIWGHVFLEARSEAWLSDVFVQPNIADGSCSVSAALQGNVELPSEAKLEVLGNDGQQVAEAVVQLDPKGKAGELVSVKATIPNPKLWTTDSPTLYRARLSLRKSGREMDAIETRFGMRQFTRDGYHLLLNGKRLMLRGYGDDHIYPANMSMPCDKQLHLARLRTIKSYGFNHVRHHSTMMPPEYYDACDEVGIIATAEFAIVYGNFMPGVGDKWIANVKPNTDPRPALETYQREWEAAIKRHRNHPSILCWVRGNELYDQLLMVDEFARIANRCDPSRWFVDTDGFYIGDIKKDRKTIPLLFTQFAEWDDPIANPNKHKTGLPAKPIISHETANYVTFSRPDLVDQFRHNIKPYWLTAGKAKLEKLGLTQEANRWAEKSERLYALLHKSNLESLRKNPAISGYHWWLFQDYWTSSNGLVDHYFRPKSISKDEVLQFNNDVVLLQDGLERTYRGHARLRPKLLVSNFSSGLLQGSLTWEATLDGRTLARKTIALEAVPQGEVAERAQIDLELPDTTSPGMLKIAATLSVGKKEYRNGWSAWLYPAQIRPATSDVPVLAFDPPGKDLAGWSVKPIPAEGALPGRAVYVVDDLFDVRIVDAVSRGASAIVLNSESPFWLSYPVTFRTSWWKAGDGPATNHCGTLVYDHPVTRAMAPAGWCDAGWFDLMEGAGKCVLEKMPAKPEVIVRALPSMALVEDEAILFQVGVGKGCLIVSGFDHRRAEGRPENQWLLARLVDHAATMPRPTSRWPASFVTCHFTAPQGCLPGFRRLTTNKGEPTMWYSYREDHAFNAVCRQSEIGNRVTWETVALPEKCTDDRVTFVFAGGLGYSSQPKTKGFALDINGKEAVQFDIPAPEKWVNADNHVELRFEKRRTVTEDQFGLFYVTIPRSMLEPGKPCQLGVRSLGSGSQRWFGLNRYSDVR